jgi:hypothetical protein
MRNIEGIGDVGTRVRLEIIAHLIDDLRESKIIQFETTETDWLRRHTTMGMQCSSLNRRKCADSDKNEAARARKFVPFDDKPYEAAIEFEF